MNQLMFNEEDTIYKLTVGDIQNVANQELERNLTNKEINNIIDSIADRIPWYDAIADAIKDNQQL
ncbi:MAG: hypothetical protein K8R37_04185 [Bacteroidales bacterium]|nr:hypothetical protein [Bacteroidales bacterium]